MKNRLMKKAMVVMASFLCLTAAVASEVLEEFLAEDRVPLGTLPVVPGVWSGDLDACKALADKEGRPLLAIWSSKGCAHCEILEKALRSDYFRNWAKTCGMVLCFTCDLDPQGQNGYKGETAASKYYWFCKRPNLIKNYPFMRFYWYEKGQKKVDFCVKGDEVDKQQGIYKNSYDKAGKYVVDYIMQAKVFGPYVPKPSYAGGLIDLPAADEADACTQLQAEPTTKSIYVPLSRESTEAFDQTLYVASGATTNAVKVSWAVDETNKLAKVENFDTSYYQPDGTVTILVKDGEGTVLSTAAVACVAALPNTASNPKWLGETFGFGEWTMDIDTAKEKVAAAEGDAYTLVAVLGSLWCHDCANTDRNFLDVEVGGVNQVSKWAQDHQVALVSVDIPNYTGANATDFASPCLLSRQAFASQLAYEISAYGMYDVSKGGAPESLAKSVLRSGMAYLSRKGVSDDEAAAQLEKFHKLACTNTAEGGFHRPEDTNANRTGVPIFVLLRKDGTVAARFTRFASKSAMTADQANIANILKRFDEMIDLAKGDANEIENNYPSAGSLSFKANGGKASGAVSAVDAQDTFLLSDLGGNALQKVTVTGSDKVPVVVSLMKLGEDGKAVELAGTSVTNSLSSGVEVEYEFTETGAYYVKVATADDPGFAYDSAESTVHAFEIGGSVVLVPQEARATAAAADDSDTVTMRLVSGQFYRITGIEPSECLDSLEPKTVDANEKFFTAKVSGDKELKCFYGKGGDVTYQIWHPGTVGFDAVDRTVREDAGEVSIPLSRQGGSSGNVTIHVALDAEASDFNLDPEGTPRFEFTDLDITWKEGEDFTTNAVVKLTNDTRYDGDGKIVLKVTIKEDEAGDTMVRDGGTFTLNVSEDDKASPGNVLFTAADPIFAKPNTVYAKTSAGAEFTLERQVASDGAVDVSLKTTLGSLSSEKVTWEHHKNAPQTVTLTGVAAGKTATVTLTAGAGGVKVPSSGKTVKVVGVADDALEFEAPVQTLPIDRYVAVSNLFILVGEPQSGKVTFTKLSGTLPAGLKATYDATENAMLIAGVPTAKAGTYPVAYQVKDGSVAGLTQMITFTVTDPTDVKNNPETSNLAMAKSRTFKDLMVIDPGTSRLVGTLQLTIPATGKVSGKLVCADGSVSLSAKSWCDFASDKTLTSALTGKNGYTAVVTAASEGAVSAVISKDGEEFGSASTDGTLWSKTDSAEDWKGYYTVILQNAGVTEEGTPGIAPRGTGYLTLKMNSSSAWNAGKVTWAGLLPNGTAISGSTLLTRGEAVAYLPVYKRSTTDVIAGALEIAAKAIEKGNRTCVSEKADAQFFWQHAVKQTEKAGFTVDLDAFGAFYDSKDDNLACFCEESYAGAKTLRFFADEADLAEVSIEETKIKLTTGQENPSSLKLSFARSTGIVNGSFKRDGVSCTYKGVILIGWGGIDCGCSETPIDFKPFIGGSYYYSYNLPYNNGRRDTTLSVKCGGAVKVEKPKPK